MKVLAANPEGYTTPPTIREIKKGETFLYEGFVCMKTSAPPNRHRWVGLSTGNCWDNPNDFDVCDTPVVRVNYTAVDEITV